MSEETNQFQIDPKDLEVSFRNPTAQFTGKITVESVIDRNIRNHLEPNKIEQELAEEKKKVVKLEAEKEVLKKKVEELETEVRELKLSRIPPPPPPPPPTPFTPATSPHGHNPFAALAQVFKFRTKPSEKKKKYRRASFPSVDIKEMEAYEDTIQKIKDGRFSLKHVDKERKSPEKESTLRPTSPGLEEVNHILENMEARRNKRLSSVSTDEPVSSLNSSFDENPRSARQLTVHFSSSPTQSPKAVSHPRLSSPELVTAAARQLAVMRHEKRMTLTPSNCSEWSDDEVTYF